MDISHYLQRIGFTGTPSANLHTLELLLRHHLLHIPFENIDIYYGIPVTLSTSSFYNKIIEQHRGGYCYELNGLFYELLSACGFAVSIVSGRVADGAKIGPEFDHMSLTVELADARWLVDAGFGDFSLKPLVIKNGYEQYDGRTSYRIVDEVLIDGKKYMAAQKWNNTLQTYKTEYVFTLTPRKLKDFRQMHHYQQTSPESTFVKNLMCSIPTAEGRISIVNNRIIKTINGQKQAETIKNDAHKNALLQKYFSLHLPEDHPIMSPFKRLIPVNETPADPDKR